ncbi:MAG: GDYXXLXY domain-containing protein [Opitutus sp.]
MKRLFVIAAVVAQIAVLAWMAGEREWVLRTGQKVYLRTAPIDPQDPMRGDYVLLNYDVATVPKSLCQGGVARWFSQREDIYNARVRDRRVYAPIRLNEEGVAEITGLSDEPPSTGIFLRGRAEAIYLSTLHVRFGVEAFFMQQGTARVFEQTVQTEKAGVPLNMEVAVGSNGLAVLKGYRWEPLGITLVPDPIPRQAGANSMTPPTRPGLRGLTVELKNHGPTPQALVVRAGGTIRMIPAQERGRTEDPSGWVSVNEPDRSTKPTQDEVRVLQSGESYRVHLDLTDPKWFVRRVDSSAAGPPVAIETLVNDWTASFRIEYAPPALEECAGLTHAELIRHIPLRSRRFSAFGGAD